MSAFDITLEQILSELFTYNIAGFISSVVRDRGDFYKSIYCFHVIDETISPIYITDIRIEIQKMVTTNSINITEVNDNE
jgi:phage-related holin